MATKILNCTFTYLVPIEVPQSVNPNDMRERTNLYYHALNLLQAQSSKPTFDIQ